MTGSVYAPPDTALAVLHADHEIVVVDKPAGLLSVPGKGPELADCLIARLQAVFPEALLVHRLDRDTSGVMLLDLKNPLKLFRELKPRKHMMEEMGAAYMAQGLVTLAGSRIYTSMADTDDVIDEALNRFEDVLADAEGGF